MADLLVAFRDKAHDWYDLHMACDILLRRKEAMPRRERLRLITMLDPMDLPMARVEGILEGLERSEGAGMEDLLGSWDWKSLSTCPVVEGGMEASVGAVNSLSPGLTETEDGIDTDTGSLAEPQIDRAAESSSDNIFPFELAEPRPAQGLKRRVSHLTRGLQRKFAAYCPVRRSSSPLGLRESFWHHVGEKGRSLPAFGRRVSVRLKSDGAFVASAPGNATGCNSPPGSTDKEDMYRVDIAGSSEGNARKKDGPISHPREKSSDEKRELEAVNSTGPARPLSIGRRVRSGWGG